MVVILYVSLPSVSTSDPPSFHVLNSWHLCIVTVISLRVSLHSHILWSKSDLHTCWRERRSTSRHRSGRSRQCSITSQVPSTGLFLHTDAARFCCRNCATTLQPFMRHGFTTPPCQRRTSTAPSRREALGSGTSQFRGTASRHTSGCWLSAMEITAPSRISRLSSLHDHPGYHP